MNCSLTEPVLEARDVHKEFREGHEVLPVLRGVSLSLRRGEVVALEGPSGSGKSTLLSILGCLLTTTSGEVIVEGHSVSGGAEDQLAAVRRRSIGFVFQQFNLFNALTARENVQYALSLKGIRGRKGRAEAERLLESVSLTDRREFLPRDLSGGQKQRVAIARALAGNSPVILADEPTANLDSHVGQQILELFRHLARQQNCALLVVTHDPKVRAIADRVLSIHDGTVRADLNLN